MHEDRQRKQRELPFLINWKAIDHVLSGQLSSADWPGALARSARSANFDGIG